MIHFILMNLPTDLNIFPVICCGQKNFGTIVVGHRDSVDYPPNMAQKKEGRNPPCATILIVSHQEGYQFSMVLVLGFVLSAPNVQQILPFYLDEPTEYLPVLPQVSSTQYVHA
jgi:hypothetical protein